MAKKINMLLQDLDQQWHVRVDTWAAQVLLGALSTDPMTMAELQRSARRFIREKDSQQLFASAIACSVEHRWEFEGPGEIEWAIDLASQRIWGPDPPQENPWEFFVAAGRAAVEPGMRRKKRRDKFCVYLVDLSRDWTFVETRQEWETLELESREQRIRERTRDVRAVLYGDPFFAFLSDQLQRAAASRRSELPRIPPTHTQVEAYSRFQPSGDSVELPDEFSRAAVWQELSAADRRRAYDESQKIERQIHSAWLLHRPAEFEGMMVRDVVYDANPHVMQELALRQIFWTEHGVSPPALLESDYAYRFGRIGRHERILYYELVRWLIEAGIELHRAMATKGGPTELQMKAHLAKVCEEWLTSHYEGAGLKFSHRQIIDQERRLVPLIVDRDSEPSDCECPICRTMSQDEVMGPEFYHLDDSHHDFGYPFPEESDSWLTFALAADCSEPYETWWEEGVEANAIDEDDLEALSQEAASAGGGNDAEIVHRPDAFHWDSDESPTVNAPRVWNSTLITSEPGSVSPEVDMFAVAAFSAELIEDLRLYGNCTELIRRVNHQVDEFAAAFRRQDVLTLSATVREFGGVLKEILQQFPDLNAKCVDLQARLEALEHVKRVSVE